MASRVDFLMPRRAAPSIWQQSHRESSGTIHGDLSWAIRTQPDVLRSRRPWISRLSTPQGLRHLSTLDEPLFEPAGTCTVTVDAVLSPGATRQPGGVELLEGG